MVKRFLLSAFFFLIPSFCFATETIFTPDAQKYWDNNPTVMTFDHLRSGDLTPNISLSSVSEIEPWLYAGVLTPNYNDLRRDVLKFTTSSIPDDAIVDSATLRLKLHDAPYSNDLNQSVCISAWSGSDFTDVDQFSSDNFVNLSDTCLAFSAESTSDYVDHPLNDVGWVDLEGTSYFGVQLSSDVNDVEPSFVSNGYSDLAFYGFGAADGDHPELVVEWHEPVVPETGLICTGTGCAINSTGSLLVTQSRCTESGSLRVGSGGGVFCNAWSTNVTIPALKFGLDSLNQTAIYAVLVGILLFILLRWVLAIIGWFWKLLTFRL